ncbi:hypothetical protein FYJ43_02715 [Cutibacterium sp. WCA-380-WT-3A]|uniref:Uncharacterized protein n=1 Tax=Cutibacterium porci TaxID=2605781 RepID=A0A7K0J4W0_9ACTN|nr:hypothetical protein [Cutibacterium porci]
MHIQTNTRTLGKQPGPPTHVGKARQAHPARQPTNRCAARPRPTSPSPPPRGHPHRLGFRNLTHYIARSLLEAGGFRPQLHPRL